MLLHRFTAALVVCCLVSGSAHTHIAVQPDSLKKSQASSASHAKWYDKISLRGYSQFRYNRLLETNSDLRCEQCDKGIGKGQSFGFRRGRLVFSGNPHDRIYLYLQFDYSADASSTSKHFMQVRDAYIDYSFDKKKMYRLRVGQSKVPYGFENLQSSQNRLPLDRSDPLNSAAPNERDMGVYFMYAPEKIRTRFKSLVDNGLKGSGDYGVLTFGAYNGQAANKPELNDQLHWVARLSSPFAIGKQVIEPGIQAYSGQFTLAKDQLTKGVKAKGDLTYTDRRVAGSLVLFPQPIGIQAEYNVGESPTFDTRLDSVTVQRLHGGYVTASFRAMVHGGYLLPYIRYQVYNGGKKLETDARRYEVHETEIGIEWQPFKNFELTLAYMISQRAYHDFTTKNYDERGNLLRVQMQVNY